MYYFISMILTCIGIFIWFIWSIIEYIKSKRGSSNRKHSTVIMSMIASSVALFLAICFLLFVLFLGLIAFNTY